MAIFSKISLGKIILERHGSLLTYCEEPVSNNSFCFCATKLWGDEESRFHLKRVNYFEHLLRFEATSISDSVFRFNIRVVKIGKFWWEEVKISLVSHQISVEEGRLSWEPIFHSWSSIPSQAAVTQSFCSYLIICCILSFAAVDPDFQKLRLPTGQVFVFNVYIGTRHHWGFSLQSWH